MLEVFARTHLHIRIDADRTAYYTISYTFTYRFALTRKRTLIETPLSFDDLTIKKHFLTACNDDDIACLHIGEFDGNDLALTQHLYFVWNILAHDVKRIGNALFRKHFKELADKHESDDHTYTIKIGLSTFCERDIDGVDICQCRSSGDKDVHIDRFCLDTVVSTSEKDPSAVEKHRGGKHPLGDIEDRLHILLDAGKVACILRDGDPHDIHRRKDRDRHTEVVIFSLFVGSALLDRRIVWKSVVADSSDHIDDLGEFDDIVIPHNRRFVVGVVDVGFDDAVHLLQRLFIEPDTRTAVDSLYDQCHTTEAVFVGFDELVVKCRRVEIL